MRFINTTSLQFEDVADGGLCSLDPGYAILSHRWMQAKEEVQYADILSVGEAVKAKAGFAKFTGACHLAKSLGFGLIWIDTCCINKTDSAELGEAINSMYRWYSMARICIVYLQDVTEPSTFAQSEWFSRGWTLQELIAPNVVRFWDCDWRHLGDKESLADQILDRTGIPEDVLALRKPAQDYSIAQRMSWAAKRTTGRVEDSAYSLMGLFDVNMPLIYGERERAFTRLQEYIVARSIDESIFVWELEELEDVERSVHPIHRGLLARSPASFAKCGDVRSVGRSEGFSINQFGVTITSAAGLYELNVYQVDLKARRGDQDCSLFLGRHAPWALFARVYNGSGESLVMGRSGSWAEKTFSVPLEPKETPVTPFLWYHGLWLRELALDPSRVKGHMIHSIRDRGQHDRFPLPPCQSGTVAIIQLSLTAQDSSLSVGWIKLGFDDDSQPVCMLAFPGSERANEKILRISRQERRHAAAVAGSEDSYSSQHWKSSEFFDGYRTRSPSLSRFEAHFDDHFTATQTGGSLDLSWDVQNRDTAMHIEAREVPDPLVPGGPRKHRVWAFRVVLRGRTTLAAVDRREESSSWWCC